MLFLVMVAPWNLIQSFVGMQHSSLSSIAIHRETKQSSGDVGSAFHCILLSRSLLFGPSGMVATPGIERTPMVFTL